MEKTLEIRPFLLNKILFCILTGLLILPVLLARFSPVLVFLALLLMIASGYYVIAKVPETIPASGCLPIWGAVFLTVLNISFIPLDSWEKISQRLLTPEGLIRVAVTTALFLLLYLLEEKEGMSSLKRWQRRWTSLLLVFAGIAWNYFTPGIGESVSNPLFRGEQIVYGGYFGGIYFLWLLLVRLARLAGIRDERRHGRLFRAVFLSFLLLMLTRNLSMSAGDDALSSMLWGLSLSARESWIYFAVCLFAFASTFLYKQYNNVNVDELVILLFGGLTCIYALAIGYYQWLLVEGAGKISPELVVSLIMVLAAIAYVLAGLVTTENTINKMAFQLFFGMDAMLVHFAFFLLFLLYMGRFASEHSYAISHLLILIPLVMAYLGILRLLQLLKSREEGGRIWLFVLIWGQALMAYDRALAAGVSPFRLRNLFWFFVWALPPVIFMYIINIPHPVKEKENRQRVGRILLCFAAGIIMFFLY